jgi:hypothetical protein
MRWLRIGAVLIFVLFGLNGCKILDALHGDGVSNGLPNVNLSGGNRITGQTSSYDISGEINSSIHDDGYYRAGEVPSFSKRSDRCVLDELSSLLWEDTPHSASAQLSQKDAYAYCDKLSLCGKSDWRLPTVKELESLLVYDDTPEVVDEIFEYASSSIYWSGTLFFGNPFGVEFAPYGGQTTLSTFIDQIDKAHVRCVEGTSSAKEWVKMDGMVFDPESKVYWQDSDEVSAIKETWNDALQYCENLDYKNRTNWRLPNVNEMLSLSDASRETNDAIFEHRASMAYGYWTSTSFMEQNVKKDQNATYAWMILNSGTTSYANKKGGNANGLAVRCISSDE